jgi:branched-chain amino acid transport system substrate-binding protein
VRPSSAEPIKPAGRRTLARQKHAARKGHGNVVWELDFVGSCFGGVRITREEKMKFSGFTSWIACAVIAGCVFGAPAAAQAQGADTAPIGVLVQLTGVSGEFGVQVQHAVDIASQELKESGVIDLKLFYEDHQIQPQLALTGFEKLIDVHDVTAVMSNGSSILLAIGPVANERERLILNIAGVTPKLRELKPWVVNIIPTADVDGRELAKLVYETEGMETAAGIHVNSEYGIASMEVFQREYEKLGGEIVATESHPTGVVDMRTQLLKIKSADPEALVIFSNEGENAHIVAQAREIGIDAQLFGTNFMLRDVHFEIAGEAMNGLKGVSFRFDPEGTAEAKSFVAKYEEAYGRPPDVSAVLAYDGARLLGEAISKVGNDPAAVREYIVSVEDWPGAIGKINFDEDGTILLNFSHYEIVDGKAQFTIPEDN